MMMLRDNSWDFVKFFLMFFVIFDHVCPASEAEWTPVIRIVGLFVMPLFFFVSGFFQSKIYDSKSLLVKFKKTIYRIVIPLLVWGGDVFLSVMKLYQLPDISNSASVHEYVKNVISIYNNAVRNQ